MTTNKWAISLISLATMAIICTSCIKPEAPNAEADILSCEIDKSLLFRSTTISNNEVVMTVNTWVDRSTLAPTFTLTDGATIEPASGTPLDFTKEQTYTVTSEDGKWKKTYKVRANVPSLDEQPSWDFAFEGLTYYHEDSDPKRDLYPIIEEYKPNGELYFQWQSGNYGVMLSQLFGGTPPEKITYCVTQDEGKVGKGAKIQTVSAGALGAMMQKPIASGSIYMGDLDKGALLGKNPLKATHFGLPFTQEPLYLTGYYKYLQGDVVIGKDGKTIEGAKDTFDLYAIFFETTNEVSYLDGTNVRTSPQLISIAEIKEEDKRESAEWLRFSIPFETIEGRSIDPEKLKAGKYSISIIASSSNKGAEFVGAIGSTLWLDELTLTCK